MLGAGARRLLKDQIERVREIGARGSGGRDDAGAGASAVFVASAWPELGAGGFERHLEALSEAGLRFEVAPTADPLDGPRSPRRAYFAGMRVRPLPARLAHAPLRVLSALAWALRRPDFMAAVRAWAREIARRRERGLLRAFAQGAVLAREAPEGARLFFADGCLDSASVARAAALLRGLPWAFAADPGDAFKPGALELRDKLASASFAAASSAAVAARLAPLAPSVERIHVIAHGVDLGRLPPPPPARPRRPETALLTVGALEEKLGVDRLLLALARLPAELRWRWRHLGGGPLQGRLTARAERLGLAPRTAFLGAAPERRAFEEMRHADLLILPGRIARNGDRAGALTAALFAASQKLAIIATPEAGVEDLVEDGVTGVYASDHPEALAAAIAALGADPQWRARLGETAHARVAARFDLRRSAQDLAALLAALERAAPLARGAARPPSPPPQPGAGAPPPPRRFVRRLS